ncbi:MAG: EAL domain-containing protein [Rhodocyclaceae bacterium]|nr:EAL domain-containing protein [Rhodocyclaceae bacterium]
MTGRFFSSTWNPLLRPFAGAPAAGGESAAGQPRSRSLARAVAHKMIVFVALLLIVSQMVVFLAIDRAVSANTLTSIRKELAVGERIFHRVLKERSEQLITAARVLTSDFAFRQAIATADQATMTSALNNHGSRIGADKMVLVSPDGHVMAAAGSLDNILLHGLANNFADLVADAAQSGTASAIRLCGGEPCQVVVVPVLAPAPIGWVVLGFGIDAPLAAELGALTALDVSFATWRRTSGWELAASTLQGAQFERLRRSLGKTLPTVVLAELAAETAEEHVTSPAALTIGNDHAVLAVLQRSMTEALARFASLRAILLGLAALSLGATIIGSLIIARSISRPVTALVEFAQRLEAGQYDQGPPAGGSDELGQLANAFNNMRLAISAREQQIKAMAYHDSLTGLPNRALFNDRLHQAIGVAKRLNHPVSVMLIDLNRFKEVNDTLGHHVGDMLLREVAVRLRGVLARASDTAARLGGDEFAVLLPTAGSSVAEDMAQRLRRALMQPVVIEDRQLDVEGSIGVATFPRHGQDPNVLMSHADAAMYFAKRKRLPCAVYEPSHEAEMDGSESLAMASELRRAVEHDELLLHYQPRLDLRSGEALHAEAMVRWQHPQRGFLSPSEFIPFAERTDCIHQVTRWVVENAFAQVSRWRKEGFPVKLSVNLSVRDLLASDLTNYLRQALREHSVSARWFTLEITESAIMDDPEHTLDTVKQLKSMGFALSLDDFGSGYSSLAMIKKLPVSEIKIDQSFVAKMDSDKGDLAIVRSVIDLAHNMNLEVVAEGVESEQALELLQELQCDHAQGYHIGMPQSASQFEQWIRQRPAPAVPRRISA